jgi:hypothetical protein
MSGINVKLRKKITFRSCSYSSFSFNLCQEIRASLPFDIKRHERIIEEEIMESLQKMKGRTDGKQ